MSTVYLLHLVICLLPFAQAMGVPLPKGHNDGRIVGGIEASILQFPHQVSLQRSGHHFCGAVIIHEQVLLTASHCIHQQKPEAISVRAGSTDSYHGGTLLNVSQIISHESYNSPTIFNNDIALLILESSLTFGRSIRPIALMTTHDVLPPKASLFVSGWGTTSPSNMQISKRLRYTAVYEIDSAKCASSYASITTVTSTMMCAGLQQGGRDSCQGDSGGPLISFINSSAKLVGIVSWGIGCARSEYPGVYTRVADYETWIRHHMTEAGGFEL